MQIELATEKYSKQIVSFFDNNLDKDNKALHSREFLCPFGVRAAIKKEWVVIGIDKDEIISAVRFYPRKTDEMVSVYQFAVDEMYRGGKLVQKMLKLTGFNKFEFKCLKGINFNNYYKKIGASINKEDAEYNRWVLKV